MPVGTAATVKGVQRRSISHHPPAPRWWLANTYHLHLQPGEAVVREAGGLARFKLAGRAPLTDSGGYQVCSAWGRSIAIDDARRLSSLPRRRRSGSR